MTVSPLLRPSGRALRVLIGCEYSGTVRRAFSALGHDAWSCDLLPAADRSNKHLVGDVREFLHMGWDLLAVYHPPCTRLCNSGVRWLSAPPPGKTREQMWTELDNAAELFSDLWNSDQTHGIKRIAVENPVMHKHAKARIRGYQRFAFSFQPWQFGHNEAKRTCIWTKGLPALRPDFETYEAFRLAHGLPEGAEPDQRVFKASPGADRWAERSKFFPGAANAMALQWGGVVEEE